MYTVEFGFGRGEKFPCFFAISVVATNSLCNGGAGTVAGERGSRGMGLIWSQCNGMRHVLFAGVLFAAICIYQHGEGWESRIIE